MSRKQVYKVRVGEIEGVWPQFMRFMGVVSARKIERA